MQMLFHDGMLLCVEYSIRAVARPKKVVRSHMSESGLRMPPQQIVKNLAL